MSDSINEFNFEGLPSWHGDDFIKKYQDDSLTYIKNNSSDSLELKKDTFALSNTTGIKTLILDGITKVGDSAFENYPNLERVIFKNTDISKKGVFESTVSIGQNAFKNCSKLKSVEFSHEVLLIDVQKDSFSGTKAEFKSSRCEWSRYLENHLTPKMFCAVMKNAFGSYKTFETYNQEISKREKLRTFALEGNGKILDSGSCGDIRYTMEDINGCKKLTFSGDGYGEIPSAIYKILKDIDVLEVKGEVKDISGLNLYAFNGKPYVKDTLYISLKNTDYVRYELDKTILPYIAKRVDALIPQHEGQATVGAIKGDLQFLTFRSGDAVTAGIIAGHGDSENNVSYPQDTKNICGPLFGLEEIYASVRDITYMKKDVQNYGKYFLQTGKTHCLNIDFPENVKTVSNLQILYSMHMSSPDCVCEWEDKKTGELSKDTKLEHLGVGLHFHGDAHVAPTFYSNLRLPPVAGTVILGATTIYEESPQIPEGVKYIEENSICCRANSRVSLSPIVLPDSVVEICPNAFSKQVSAPVILNEGLQRIDRNAFSEYPNTGKIKIPNSVLIEDKAFDNSKIQSFELSESSKLKSIRSLAAIYDANIGADKKILYDMLPSDIQSKMSAYRHSTSNVNFKQIGWNKTAGLKNTECKTSVKIPCGKESFVVIDYRHTEYLAEDRRLYSNAFNKKASDTFIRDFRKTSEVDLNQYIQTSNESVVLNFIGKGEVEKDTWSALIGDIPIKEIKIMDSVSLNIDESSDIPVTRIADPTKGYKRAAIAANYIVQDKSKEMELE